MFLNPIMLAGLGAAAIPLVLHMLSRARLRGVDWGAMMFLDDGSADVRQSARLRQAVILGLRMLVLTLAAVALARPVIRGAMFTATRDAPATVVIVLDQSASMSYEEQGRTRVDRARQATMQILSTLRPGDEAAVVTVGGAGGDSGPQTTADVARLGRWVASLGPPARGGDIADGLRRAAQFLDRAPRAGRVLYIVADRQESSWRRVNAAFFEQWARTFGDRRPAVVYVPIGNSPADNVAIESMALAEELPVAGFATELRVRIRNYSPTAQTAIPLTVRAARAGGEDDRSARRTTVSLPAGGEVTVKLPLTLYRAEPYVVTARIDAPGLPADARHDLAVDVLGRPRVMIISGDEQDAQRAEAQFARLALSPSLDRRDLSFAEVEVVASDPWPAGTLRGYQAVVLANVPQVSTAAARELEQFLYEGGGVLIAPGDLSRFASYNSRLAQEPGGLMPARLSAPSSVAPPLTLAAIDRAHPIFRFLPADSAPAATVTRRFAATPREGTRVLATLSDGSPLLLERSYGRGQVLLMTTPLDADWSDLPYSNLYLPMVQRSIWRLASSARPALNLAPREPLVAELDESVPDRGIEIYAPDDRRLEAWAMEITRSGQRVQVRSQQTAMPGIYRLRYALGRDARMVPFVVRVQDGESDLSPADDAMWAKITAGLGLTQLRENPDAVGAAIQKRQAGFELWPMFLAASILAAISELWLTRRWTA